MEYSRCPGNFMPEPTLVPESVLESIKKDLGFGNFIDLFENWENTCDRFWEKADNLIFEKGALAGSDLDLEVFFDQTSKELFNSLIMLLHERYENQVDTALDNDQIAELDNFYLSLLDNLFHIRVVNNESDARALHQRMAMNGFPLSCGDAYFSWPESEAEKIAEKKFYEETLGLTLISDKDESKD